MSRRRSATRRPTGRGCVADGEEGQPGPGVEVGHLGRDGRGGLARGDDAERFLPGGDPGASADRAAGGGVPGVEDLLHGSGDRSALDHGAVAEVLQTDGLPLREGVIGRRHQQQCGGARGRQGGEARLVDRQPYVRHVHVARQEQVQRGCGLDLAVPDAGVGVAGQEQVERVLDPEGVRAHGAEGQGARGAPGDGPGRLDALLDLPVSALERAVQLLAEGREADAARGAVEQGAADEPFLLLDRLADAPRADAQPLGGAAEVQLLRQRQKDLDLPHLHARPPWIL